MRCVVTAREIPPGQTIKIWGKYKAHHPTKPQTETIPIHGTAWDNPLTWAILTTLRNATKTKELLYTKYPPTTTKPPQLPGHLAQLEPHTLYKTQPPLDSSTALILWTTQYPPHQELEILYITPQSTTFQNLYHGLTLLLTPHNPHPKTTPNTTNTPNKTTSTKHTPTNTRPTHPTKPHQQSTHQLTHTRQNHINNTHTNQNTPDKTTSTNTHPTKPHQQHTHPPYH